MRTLPLTVLLSLSSGLLAFDHGHGKWDNLLKKYVNTEGYVNYGKWKASPQEPDSYLGDLQKVTYKEYTSFSKEQKSAFLINAYNAFTVKLIIDNYPIKSIKKIGGLFSPWKKEFFSILDGKIKSLDPIEHEWLRKKPELKDPRVHAAVNCASISCLSSMAKLSKLPNSMLKWMPHRECGSTTRLATSFRQNR